jgi:hypothetical protein
MRLKNNSDKDFAFEGTQIPAGESSSELSPELAGRLLALFWHNPLEPIETPDVETPEVPAEAEGESKVEEA